MEGACTANAASFPPVTPLATVWPAPAAPLVTVPRYRSPPEVSVVNAPAPPEVTAIGRRGVDVISSCRDLHDVGELAHCGRRPPHQLRVTKERAGSIQSAKGAPSSTVHATLCPVLRLRNSQVKVSKATTAPLVRVVATPPPKLVTSLKTELPPSMKTLEKPPTPELIALPIAPPTPPPPSLFWGAGEAAARALIAQRMREVEAKRMVKG